MPDDAGSALPAYAHLSTAGAATYAWDGDRRPAGPAGPAAPAARRLLVRQSFTYDLT